MGRACAFTAVRRADGTLDPIGAQRTSAIARTAVAIARRARVVDAIDLITFFTPPVSTMRRLLWRFGRGVAVSSVNLTHAP
jgi:predicted dehydrogenase